MSAFKLKHVLAGIAMLAAAAGAVVMKPTLHLADQRPINLEKMIPTQFGEWSLDQSIVPVQVDPEVQAKLNKIYSQLISRTYVNAAGQRVMLSISYGADQSDQHQVHRPEICYPAQGMPVQSNTKILFDSGYGLVPAKSLVAIRQGGAYEPILYWVTVGDRAVATGNQQKFEQLHYGLRRLIPDGMIVRVSTLSVDPDDDRMLKTFTRALLSAMSQPSRMRLGLTS